MGIEELINGCKKNDSKSQEQLYRLFVPKLFPVCLKYSRSYAEAQDNLQDGFLLIFDKIHQFSFSGSFEGWIKRVMINHVLQQYRKESFLTVVDENTEAIEETELDADGITHEYLIKIIQELPDRYRLVFNLYVLDGYSHQEVAEMLQITVGTSKSNLSRAKQLLKDKIEAYTGTSKMPKLK